MPSIPIKKLVFLVTNWATIKIYIQNQLSSKNTTIKKSYRLKLFRDLIRSLTTKM